MGELQIFDVEGSDIRFGLTEDGIPYSVATDYAKTLGYGQASDATRLLEDDEKGQQIVLTPGGPQLLNVIYEDGMWELIFRSTLPGAKAIKKRVKAILREIRETGSYSATPVHDIPRTLPEALRAYADAVEQRDAAEARIAELEPAADAWNVLAEAKGDYSLREAAQILSRDPLITTGQNRLMRYLRQIGWVDGTKQPYQSQIDNGRLARRTRDYTHQASGEKRSTTQVRIKTKGLKELRARMAGQQQLVVIEGGA